MHNAQDISDAMKDFIRANGYRCRAHEMGAVLGCSPELVEQIRRKVICTKLSKNKLFVELFTLWNGRLPSESDWPPPRKIGDGYEWQEREIAFLISLVGSMSLKEIAAALSERLKLITGDRKAKRNQIGVQIKINRVGLHVRDVVGGISVPQAGKEIGSLSIVHHALDMKQIRSFKIGRQVVIPRDAWEEWKSKRVLPPQGLVLLSSLRESLAIRSDKLSEFARMGYVPTAVCCVPYGAKG